MRNLCVVCILCAFLGVVVNAKESNGVFVGFEIGAGEQQMTINNPTLTSLWTHFGTISRGNEGTGRATSAIFGAKIGYKHFFLDWIGIRGYASIDYSQSLIQSKDATSRWTGILSDIIYNANVDILLNFYNGENTAFGAFVGVGVGGQTIWDRDFIMGDKTRDMTDLYSDIKVGLRVNVAQNHEMEFITKIPLNQAKETFEYNIEAKYKQLYAVMLGYNFAF